MSAGKPISETPKYMIGAVTKLTGLSIDVVRVWERRYGAVRPARSDGGTRLYSDADVLRLRRLRQAVEKGFSIGQAAKLSDAELDELLTEDAPADDGRNEYRALRERFIEAVQKMDASAADQEMARAASLFPASDLIKEICEPLAREIEQRWFEKTFGAAHEALANESLRRMLASLFRFYPASAGCETVVCATPVERSGTVKLLLAALLAATQGWRVVYLGSGLPAADIAYAVRLTGAHTLALTAQTYSIQSERELQALSQLLPHTTRVLVVGNGDVNYASLIRRAGWLQARDMGELAEQLVC